MPRRTVPITVSLGLALACCAVGGCGGTKRAFKLKPHDVKAIRGPTTRRRGGALRVVSGKSPRGVDPGAAASELEYQLAYATQRPLYSYRAGSTAPVPDLAIGPAAISDDAHTVTVHLRKGVRFSPPINREATSRDVAYGIERGANPTVGNVYFKRYFSMLRGARSARGGPISGITTPGLHTIVFHLDRPWARGFADALVLPLTAPVPAGLGRRYDRENPSHYEDHLAATGPYMIEEARTGRALDVGYDPGKRAILVRNPNWQAATDFRPAYLDRITFRFGADASAIGRSVLSGRGMAEDEASLASTQLAARQYKRQLAISPYFGLWYVAINNMDGPFANEEARRALWASLDRAAMSRALGGPTLAHEANRFLYPGMPGFENAKAMASPRELPYLDHPRGDLVIARQFMRKAGYVGGMYKGRELVSVIGASGGSAAVIARMTNASLRQLGFHTRLRLLRTDRMETLCGLPASRATVCPNASLEPAFADPQALLLRAFDGQFISLEENDDWGQVDNPDLNSALEREAEVVNPVQREEGWAAMDNGLVTEAAGIPYAWERGASIESSNVAGVAELWNRGAWDLAFSYIRP
jgi:peptide/nickel transport system substrate-binding protein